MFVDVSISSGGNRFQSIPASPDSPTRIWMPFQTERQSTAIFVSFLKKSHKSKLGVNDMATFCRSCFLNRSCLPFRNTAAFWVKPFGPNAKRQSSVRRNWPKRPVFPRFLLAESSVVLNHPLWTIFLKSQRLLGFGFQFWLMDSKPSRRRISLALENIVAFNVVVTATRGNET